MSIHRTRVVNKHYEAFDVYIGRGSIWGNKFIIGKHGTREEVIEKYDKWIRKRRKAMKQLHRLVGMRLGCYCKPKPCHGDVLIKIMQEKGLII